MEHGRTGMKQQGAARSLRRCSAASHRRGRVASGLGVVALGMLLMVLAPVRADTTVAELVRFTHEGDTVLQGLGLVVGLSGTGDSSKDLLIARPLAEVYRNMGNPIASMDELARGKSAALVMIEVRLPPGSAKNGDQFDAIVSVMHSATSLRGGRLLIAPVSGPLPGQGVYAFAAGGITLDDSSVPTVGRVRLGARMSRNLDMPALGDAFDLVVRPAFAGWASASHIAGTINSEYFLRARARLRPVATALDDRTIRVEIPEIERDDRPGFVAMILNHPINPTLLRLPPRVVVNQASGTIIMTADVEISPVGIIDSDLSITTTTTLDPGGAEGGAQQAAGVATSRMAGVQKGAIRPSTAAKLQDLLAAFRQLDVPVAKQVHILQMLDRMGQLHADLIID